MLDDVRGKQKRRSEIKKKNEKEGKNACERKKNIRKINKGTEENRMTTEKRLKIKTTTTKNGWKFQTKFLQNIYNFLLFWICSCVFFLFKYLWQIGKGKKKINTLCFVIGISNRYVF